MSGEFIRFLLVGVLNTIAGYLVFLLGHWAFGLNAYMANALAYLIVVIAAYFLTAVFVFKRPIETRGFIQFMLCFVVAFGVNQLVLMSMLMLTGLPAEIAQIFAMGSYTVVFFALNKFIVFKPKPSDPGSDH